MLEHEDVTDRIIGAAIEVHRKPGPGFIESVYEAALCVELRKRAVQHARQVLVPVLYDGVEVGQHRLDLLVEGEIVVELKAVRALEDVHFSIVRSYLRAVGRRHGLLLNFDAPTLEIRRVIAPQGSCIPDFLPSSEAPAAS
jgi:GxxExxY protein